MNNESISILDMIILVLMIGGCSIMLSAQISTTKTEIIEQIKTTCTKQEQAE